MHTFRAVVTSHRSARCTPPRMNSRNLASPSSLHCGSKHFFRCWAARSIKACDAAARKISSCSLLINIIEHDRRSVISPAHGYSFTTFQEGCQTPPRSRCTGICFGEALRLRMRDVDTRSAVLFVDTFKGRSDGFRFIVRYHENSIDTSPLAWSTRQRTWALVFSLVPT